MGSKEDGYVMLAYAVIKRAGQDARSKQAYLRDPALADIAAGGLGPWIDLFCSRYDLYHAIQAGLTKLLRDTAA